MKRQWLVLFALMPVLTWACNPKALSATELESGYVGKLVQAFECQDRYGVYEFVLSRQTKGQFGEPGFSDELHYYQFLHDHGGTIQQWEVRDFASALCQLQPLDFQVKDWDKDGRLETLVRYSSSCDGLDADPMKLLVLHNNSKYAIRGTSAKQAGDVSQRNVAFEFAGLPKAIRAAALALWDSDSNSQPPVK